MAKATVNGLTLGTPAAIASLRAPPMAKISRPQRVYVKNSPVSANTTMAMMLLSEKMP